MGTTRSGGRPPRGWWLLTLLLSGPVAAQVSPPTGSLSGLVLDSVSGQPLPYATVVLLAPAAADKLVSGVAADAQGRYALTQLPPGSYALRASSVGHASSRRPVQVTAAPPGLKSCPLRKHQAHKKASDPVAAGFFLQA